MNYVLKLSIFTITVWNYSELKRFTKDRVAFNNLSDSRVSRDKVAGVVEVSNMDTHLCIIWRPTNIGLCASKTLFFEWSLSLTYLECISNLSITGIRCNVKTVMSDFIWKIVSLGFIYIYISMSSSFLYWVKAAWCFCFSSCKLYKGT